MRSPFVIAAVLLGCAGIALLGIGFIDLSDLARRYSPDGVVSEHFLRDVALRSRFCAAIVFAIALITAFAPALVPSAFAGQRTPAAERTHWRTVTPWIVIAIGATTRAMLLNDPLHWDEAFTFNEFVRRPPIEFLSRYTHPNNHVFHTVLAWLTSTVSEQRWVLRLPAFLAGAAVLALVYDLAAKLRGTNTALIATALAAGASPLVEYSAQGRGYTMITCATLLLFLIPRERWLLAATIAALGAWAIPVMLFPFAAYLAWLLLERTPLPRVALVAVATGALTFLLYLPILVVSGPRSITENGNVQSLPFLAFAHELPRSLGTVWDAWVLGLPAVARVALAVAAIAALARGARRGEAPARLAMAAIAGIAPLLLALHVLPFPRVWICMLPLFLLLAASGAVSERWPRATISIAAIVLSAALGWNALRATERPSFFENPTMAEIPAIAAFLRAEMPEDTSLLAVQPLDAPLAFEMPGDPRLVQKRFDSDPASVAAALRARARVWTIIPHGWNPGYGRIRRVRAFQRSDLWEIR